MPLFDAYAMVDWSAANAPRRGADSIWIATARGGARGRRLGLTTLNPPTREEAGSILRELLLGLSLEGRRVLVGWDFAFGTAEGFAHALGAARERPPWRFLWNALAGLVEDRSDNRNNRFEVAATLNARVLVSPEKPGPFWGCPASRQTPFLRARRKAHGPAYPYPCRGGSQLEEFRVTERRLRERGGWVHPVWKLYTAGAVGSQTLLGIPRVLALRDDATLAPWSRVWPFETGFVRAVTPRRGPFIVHAEVWPGLVECDTEDERVKDEVQVTALVTHLAGLDERGLLGALFLPEELLAPDEAEPVLREEGWILGA